ncbi:MAG: heme biosynthesis protein HemY [Betaproteobacteria bacterium]|nr:heme biosynthesis protein HemY [Betaproteobacteria bacterium]
MRWVLFVLALFALAVALALALRYNDGYALFVWPPYRIELSINLFALLLGASFVAGYLLVRFIFGALALPSRVREYREQRRRDNSRAVLQEAVGAFFEGRFGRAEKAAASVAEVKESAGIGSVLAAYAAHELRRYDERDAYLARAEQLAPDASAMRVIAAADMLLDQRRFQEALAALKGLPEKHTAALRLELKAQQQAKNWDQVLPLVDQLERRKVFDATQAGQLRHYAHAENLSRKALDPRSLDECWQKIPADQKRDGKVAGAAAQAYLAMGGVAQAQQIIEQALAAAWDSELVGMYADGQGDTVRQIERAEQWLKNNPRDAALLLTLGRLCARQELWGKAQNYLEASISVDPLYSAHLELAQLHDRLGNTDAARRHFRESLELAVSQLRQISGGRRRAPI